MFEIRFARPDDAATLLEFIRALARYERMPDAVEVDEATLRAQMSEANPPFECLLAERSGHALGFALFFYSYSTWRGRRGLWLEDLFVLPEERRNGVGRALLERIAAIAVERGCARFEWSVLDWNEPALAFYRSLGVEIMAEWRICRISDAPLARLAAGDA